MHVYNACTYINNACTYIDKLRREFRSLISMNHCLQLAMAEWKHIMIQKGLRCSF